MKRGNFDERCPHCGVKVDVAIRVAWECADYSEEFLFDCHVCAKSIKCEVHTVYEFELIKDGLHATS